jgi:hypothetical protein
MLAQKAEACLAKMEGTPGYPNRPLSRQTNLIQTNCAQKNLAAVPANQVEYEQFNAHGRGKRPATAGGQAVGSRGPAACSSACAFTLAAGSASTTSRIMEPPGQGDPGADQILQSGGFRVVVLDLASVPAEQALRIPAATWFRFRRAAEVSDAILLVLSNGVGPSVQEEIIEAISSFALYGFPESHAASFALIAYASAWLKFHYLAAFTAAILNNHPMGFCSPAVPVKDGQRHGLRVKPVDVLRSAWPRTLEQEENGTLSLRLGLRYVRGLPHTATAELEAAAGCVRLRPSKSWPGACIY